MWLRLAMRSTSALLLSSLLLLLCFGTHHVSGDEDNINSQENVSKEEETSSDNESSVKFGAGSLAFNGGANWMMTFGQWIKVRRKSDGGIEVYVVHRPADSSMNRKKTITSKPDPEPGDENDVDEFRRRRRRQVLPILA